MFYKTGVDISSVKSMWNFLHDHFTYSTMNSWNGQTSIANNVKVYNLKLEGDWTVALRYLTDDADSGLLQMCIDEEIREFERKYRWYRVGFNGRSNGYLVLYNRDNYLSILPDCVTEYESYDDFKTDSKWQGYALTDFLGQLRDAVEIVREFDKLCDRLRDLVNDYSLRSFDTDKLEVAIESFNTAYGDDLDSLGLTGPIMDNGRVELNCLTKYASFMYCFLSCLGEPHARIATNNTHLWLKEN